MSAGARHLPSSYWDERNCYKWHQSVAVDPEPVRLGSSAAQRAPDLILAYPLCRQRGEEQRIQFGQLKQNCRR